MTTIQGNEENLKQAIEGEGIVLVDFWAPWCGPCRVFGPVFEKVSDEFADASFVKVNTQDEQKIAAMFQIEAIPTLMVFRDSVMLFRQAGVVPEAGLREIITQAQQLDMDQVRKEIAESEAADKAGGSEEE